LIEHRLLVLTAEVQDLRHELKAALSAKTNPPLRWLSSAELAKITGIAPRTVGLWITQGRIPPTCYTKRARGDGFTYRLDREPAIAAVESIISGRK
jgi:hypothetical protein